MTYHNAVKFIQNAPVSYEGPLAFDRIRLLLAYVGNPHKNVKYLRLAGSNGKTILAEMLSEVLKSTSHRVGCLKMPIRKDLRENISVDTLPIGIEETTSLVKILHRSQMQIQRDYETFPLAEKPDGGRDTDEKKAILHRLKSENLPAKATRSELLFALAIMYFKYCSVDFCIIEGEHTTTDPSFVLPPPFATVICGTIPREPEEISKIRQYIKQGIMEIVSAPQNKEAFSVISETCAAINCRLSVPARCEIKIKKSTLKGTEFIYRGKEYSLGLVGKFQVINAAIAIESLKMITRCGFEVDDAAIAKGLKYVRIKSKFEVISVFPTIIADSTHASVAVRTICDSLAEFREITGIKINLCLPYSLIPEYVCYLTSIRYEVRKIFTVDNEISEKSLTVGRNAPHPVTVFKNAKLCAEGLISECSEDEIIFISGTYDYTDSVRFEIARKLSYN
jgi:dihydrofolate synthase/folylpolyglutamate synthase